MEPIRINFEKNEIVVSSQYAKCLNNPNSPEWEALQNLLKVYPNLKIKKHHIKKNESKESYKGLTYDYMREYIQTHEKGAARNSSIAEFEEQLFLSKCHTVRYPAVKKWFLSKYPEILEYGMISKNESITNEFEELLAA